MPLLFVLIVGKIDEVPNFVLSEFSYDLKEGDEDEVVAVCPFCHRTM